MITSCALFKDTTKSSNEVYAASKVIRFYSDSSGYEKEVLIWPKGNFSYSPGTGFFGAAEKLELKEKGGASIGSLEMKSKQYSAEEKTVVRESTLDGLLWILVAGAGVYLSFKIYKKWQF
ncbi:hypothetical protein QG516_13205 [Pedobacter gandavensis]|uniref:hypothetical protein n=1 Tax=Pedobacter gandavensis TaxID=2679963 RepID=UPI0024785E54|nr:hypothetical protein [Pedobacter gandavensis]WGQ07525.1 hypothetical protein QG516_13205 [Pedobacter gandavensis]